MQRVLDAMTSALEHTKEMLFVDFDIAKWVSLGLAAWLMTMCQGGGGGNAGNVDPELLDAFSGDSAQQGLRQLLDWMAPYQTLVVAGVAVLLLLVIGLGVVLPFLQTRGELILIDGVARDRAAFGSQWTEVGPQANPLTGFRIVVGLLQTFLFLGAFGIVGWQAGTAILAGSAINWVLLAGVVGAWLVLALLIGLPIWVLEILLPKVMYARGCGLGEGIATSVQLITGDIGAFVVFVVFRIAIAFATGILSVMISCVLCCVMWVPYVGTVLLLPLIVFPLAFDLHFIAGYGAEYARLGPGPGGDDA